MSNQRGGMDSDDSQGHDLFNGRGSTRRDVLKAAVGFSALAALGPAISACGGESTSTSASPSSTTGGTPKTGGHVRVGTLGGSAKDTLDAQKPLTQIENTNVFQLYQPIMDFDPNGRLINCLAESVETNSTATEWTVRLQSGLEFHNGKTVTADDVIFSYQRIMDEKMPGASLIDAIQDMKALDDRTVRFTLKTPNSILPEGFAYFRNNIVPVDYDPSTTSGAIGTGPWKIDSFVPGEEARFSANPNFWGTGPYADQLSVIGFQDPTARQNALLGGSLDIISSASNTVADVLLKTPGFDIITAETGGHTPFLFRTDEKPWTDIGVRQALKFVVDRPAMVEQGWAGYGRPGNDMWGVYDPGYPSDLPQREQDLEQAKSLLKKAGYDNDLTLTLTTSDEVLGNAVALSQILAEQAKGAGVTIKVNKVGPGVIYGDQYMQWNFSQDYWPTRGYLAEAALSTGPMAPYDMTHWTDEEWLKLETEAFKTADDAKRNEIVREMATIDYNRGGNIVWGFMKLADGYSTKLIVDQPDNWGMSAIRCRYNLVHFA